MSTTSLLRAQIKSIAASTNTHCKKLQVAHACQIKHLFEKNKHFLWAKQITLFISKSLPLLVNFKGEISGLVLAAEAECRLAFRRV